MPIVEVKVCKCQTRLKLKFDNIQHSIFMFEECHLSQYHQSEGCGVWMWWILPLKMYFVERRASNDVHRKSWESVLELRLATILAKHIFVSE
jgi:hypothetical protein